MNSIVQLAEEVTARIVVEIAELGGDLARRMAVVGQGEQPGAPESSLLARPGGAYAPRSGGQASRLPFEPAFPSEP